MKTVSQKEKTAPISGKPVAWVRSLLDSGESNHKIELCEKVYFGSFTVCRATKVYHLLLNFSRTAMEVPKWLQMHNLILDETAEQPHYCPEKAAR